MDEISRRKKITLMAIALLCNIVFSFIVVFFWEYDFWSEVIVTGISASVLIPLLRPLKRHWVWFWLVATYVVTSIMFAIMLHLVYWPSPGG